MKRVFALAALVALIVAAAAVAADDQPTKIKFSEWKVVTDEGKASVEPRETYRHCPSNPVRGLVVIGKMSHPGKKGVHYAITWKHNGEFVTGQDYKTGKHGKVRAQLSGGGETLGDGKWEVFALRQGAPVGKSKIKIVSGGPAC